MTNIYVICSILCLSLAWSSCGSDKDKKKEDVSPKKQTRPQTSVPDPTEEPEDLPDDHYPPDDYGSGDGFDPFRYTYSYTPPKLVFNERKDPRPLTKSSETGFRCFVLSGVNKDHNGAFKSEIGTRVNSSFAIAGHNCNVFKTLSSLWDYTQSDELGSDDRIMIFLAAHGNPESVALDHEDMQQSDFVAMTRKLAKTFRVFITTESCGSGAALRQKLLFDLANPSDPSIDRMCMHTGSLFNSVSYTHFDEYLLKLNKRYAVSAEELYDLRPYGLLSSAAWDSVGFSAMLAEHEKSSYVDTVRAQVVLQEMAKFARLVPFDSAQFYEQPLHVDTTALFPSRTIYSTLPMIPGWGTFEGLKDMHAQIRKLYTVGNTPLSFLKRLGDGFLAENFDKQSTNCLAAFAKTLTSETHAHWKLIREFHRFKTSPAFISDCGGSYSSSYAEAFKQLTAKHSAVKQLVPYLVKDGFENYSLTNLLHAENKTMQEVAALIEVLETKMYPILGDIAWTHPPHEYAKFVDLSKQTLSASETQAFKTIFEVLLGDPASKSFTASKDDIDRDRSPAHYIMQEFTSGSIKANSPAASLDQRRRAACRDFVIGDEKETDLSKLIDKANDRLTELSKNRVGTNQDAAKKIYITLIDDLKAAGLTAEQRQKVDHLMDMANKVDEAGARWKNIESLRQMLRQLKTIAAFM